MRPAAFFDRDGTLIRDVGFVSRIEDIDLLDGAARSVARVRLAGFATVVVTNQSGVGRGLFDEESVRGANTLVRSCLIAADEDAVVDAFYVCPHAPGETGAPVCFCRKPLPGLLLRAAGEMDLDVRSSLMIGDRESDVEAGRAAGCAVSLQVGAEGGVVDIEGAVMAALALVGRAGTEGGSQR